MHPIFGCVLRLLKSWEYKNEEQRNNALNTVLRLLKSWEYKNPLKWKKKDI